MSKKLVKVIGDSIKKLNLYETYDDDTNEERENQILSTRIFLVLFMISLTTLIGYASLNLESTSVLVRDPTQQTYEQLYSLYPETLICPCTQTSIQIDKFIEANVEYHQICSSKFVDTDWISTLSPMIPQMYYTLDIRRIISSELQVLSSYCQSARTIISDAMTALASSQLFVPLVLSRDNLKSQARAVVEQVKINAMTELEGSRSLIQSYYQQNQFVSALGSNYIYTYASDDVQMYSFTKYIINDTYPPNINYTSYLDSEVCSCIDSSDCSYPSGIYANLSGHNASLYDGAIFPPLLSVVQIPSIHIACMAYDALILSTLECFYDLNCIKLLFNQTDDIQPLTTNKSSNYPITSTLNTYIESSFIENITNDEDFKSFYRECQPTKCTYTYNSRGNIVFIITTILSLIGGLFTSLKVAAPFLLQFYVIIRKKFSKKRITSSVTISDLDKQTKKGFSPREILQKLQQFANDYNLFKQQYNDDHGRRNEILSTKVYVFFMTLSVVIIIFYSLIIEHTLTFHVGSLSIGKYRDLYSRYPTLSCECENITNEYSVFITFNPRQHQLCTSIFMSDILKPRYYRDQSVLPISKFDILVAESSFYVTLRSSCDLGGFMINLAVTGFRQTVYISSYLTDEKEFYSRMNAAVDSFVSLAPTTYSHLFDLTRALAKGNQLLTGTFTNAELRYNRSASNEEDMIEVLWQYPNNQSCNCGLSDNSCSMTYDDYCNHTYHENDTSIQTCLSPIPGLRLACYIVEGLLESSQECFFHRECVLPTAKLLLKYYNASEAILNIFTLTLDPNIPSRYAINATTEEIINTFAVEDWNSNITYDSYYANCQPVNCYYTITKKFHIATIITTVIGLVGGVSVALKILVPLLINLIQSKQRAAREENSSKLFYIRVLFKKIRELNWFVTRETYQSVEIRRDQIISTRLYVLLLMLSVGILSVYFGFATKSTLIVIENPTMNDYKQLHSEDLHEFACPCSKTSLSFETFTTFDFTFHQICSSDFVSLTWRTNLFNFDRDKQEVSRGILSSHFEFIHLFCTSSNTTYTLERSNLYTNQYISINAVPENQFRTQIQAAIGEFEMKIISAIRHGLAQLMNTTLANQFMTVYETNWFFIPDPAGSDAIYTKARTYQSGNCSCASPKAIDCADPLVVGERNTSVIGMKIGCLPLTSLRLSTLECFYNQTCVDEVKASFQLQNLSITALDSSQSSQYSLNTTLDYIIDSLFLEQSTENVNYSAYYEQCNPQQCSYSLVARNSVLSIFTTLLGLYGGLTVALRLIAPVLVKIARKIIDRCQSTRAVSPQQAF